MSDVTSFGHAGLKGTCVDLFTNCSAVNCTPCAKTGFRQDFPVLVCSVVLAYSPLHVYVHYISRRARHVSKCVRPSTAWLACRIESTPTLCFDYKLLCRSLYISLCRTTAQGFVLGLPLIQALPERPLLEVPSKSARHHIC